LASFNHRGPVRCAKFGHLTLPPQYLAVVVALEPFGRLIFSARLHRGGAISSDPRRIAAWYNPRRLGL